MRINDENRDLDNQLPESSFQIADQLTYMQSKKRIAEVNILESENQYHYLFETMKQGVVFHDKTGRLINANPAAEKILGYTLSQLQNMTSENPEWGSLYPDGTHFPADKHPSMLALKTGQNVMNQPMGVYNPVLQEYRWIVISAEPVYRAGEEVPFQVYTIFDDVTEKLKIDSVTQFLRDNMIQNTKMNYFQKLAIFLAKTLEMEFVCIDQLSGDNLTAHTLAVYSEGKFEDNISYTLKDTPCGKVVEKQFCVFEKGVRNLFPYDEVLQEMKAESYLGTTLFDVNGNRIGLIAIIGRKQFVNTTLAEEILRLITIPTARELERMINEDKIISLLKEKEILLKEVHHRIKNNMNTINGLLSLQASYLNDSHAIKVLKDVESRINAMMVLYDQLYLSHDYSNLSFKTYFEPLIKKIISIFPNKDIVTLETNLEEFELDSKKLSHIGIMINELLTNIMKYAFLGRSQGKIVISSEKINNNIMIKVKDDGNGLPRDFDINTNSSFGLQLLNLMVKQINATFNYSSSEEGTEFCIKFNT